MNKKTLSIFITFILTFSMAAYGHSGRTDGSGGHKDNKNKSGLGYYHYHHGLSAHLHDNGVCPYDVKTNNNVKTSNGVNIKKVQNKLNELGYDCGNADGNMGEKTKKSIEQFQKDNGLTVDGKLGSKTLKTLGI